MGETIEAGDTTDRVKPWTIKGIAPEERNAAIAAAEREGLAIGEWLTGQSGRRCRQTTGLTGCRLR
jgi:hypothetical protein